MHPPAGRRAAAAVTVAAAPGWHAAAEGHILSLPRGLEAVRNTGEGWRAVPAGWERGL